ncbi:heat shock protein transcriptional repressor HspR [Allokutzneria albata]|uniref:MerR family transcriptional regulator, heat shock protein HspR n=1 Tax=Allokutzneria albata TaxID=211114 RepID=A0A1G9ZHW4_ALLAB|nr:helix-turn-helix transcriptional regulator [Allokutzneria albata]SDN20909.1 MerR family transcriptional regulator, heat shock protein HspR [Allokutzneria albata]
MNPDPSWQGIPAAPGTDEDTPVFVISVAAQLAGLHAQTLRTYDRLGLVSPGRSPGGGRRYSARDITLLRQVQRLSQEEGISLSAIKRIIDLEQHVDALSAKVSELTERLADAHEQLAAAHAAAESAAAAVHASYRHDLVPVKPQSTALVIWRPRPRR